LRVLARIFTNQAPSPLVSVLHGGKATFEMEPGVYEGTVSFYDDGSMRTLVLDDCWKSFVARVTPQG
jgi:hypothetical protein